MCERFKHPVKRGGTGEGPSLEGRINPRQRPQVALGKGERLSKAKRRRVSRERGLQVMEGGAAEGPRLK